MSPMLELGAARPMCSLIARASGEDPIGSMSGYSRYLIAEIPLPWAPGIMDSPRFPAVLREVLARHPEVRFQAVVPDAAYSRPGHTRVIDARRPAAPSAAFTTSAYLVPTASLGRAVDALLAAGLDEDPLGRYRVENDGRDFLVCTHGTKDACCASFGYPAYRTLRYDLAPDAGEPLRVWRVNHLGGHRFAPTMLALPDGRGWAHLDDEALRRIVRQDGALPDLWAHYRGWTLLDGLPQMLVEREAFQREGWDWTRARVRGKSWDEGDGRHAVRLGFAYPDGAAGAYTALVEPTGEVTVSRGSCGDEAPQETPVWRVRNLSREAEVGSRESEVGRGQVAHLH